MTQRKTGYVMDLSSWRDRSGGDFARRCYAGHPPLPLPGDRQGDLRRVLPQPRRSSMPRSISASMPACASPGATALGAGRGALFPVRDMAAPDDAAQFRKLVEWTKGEVDAGRKVHVGCIGGHGRTGTFLAALVSLYGEPDAVALCAEPLLQAGGREQRADGVPRASNSGCCPRRRPRSARRAPRRRRHPPSGHASRRARRARGQGRASRSSRASRRSARRAASGGTSPECRQVQQSIAIFLPHAGPSVRWGKEPRTSGG